MSEEVTINRYSTRPWIVGSLMLSFLGVGVILVGLLVLWPLALLGLPLLVVAVMIDRKRWHCGNCGNRVEKVSTMCPVCRARLMSTAEYKRIYRASVAETYRKQREARAARKAAETPKVVRRVKKKTGPRRGGMW